MWPVWIVVGVLMAGNALVTWRVWRNDSYERGQKIGQTLLVWLIPGSALVVNGVMTFGGRASRDQDPTGPHGTGPEVEWDIIRDEALPHHDP